MCRRTAEQVRSRHKRSTGYPRTYDTYMNGLLNNGNIYGLVEARYAWRPSSTRVKSSLRSLHRKSACSIICRERRRLWTTTYVPTRLWVCCSAKLIPKPRSSFQLLFSGPAPKDGGSLKHELHHSMRSTAVTWDIIMCIGSIIVALFIFMLGCTRYALSLLRYSSK